MHEKMRIQDGASGLIKVSGSTQITGSLNVSSSIHSSGRIFEAGSSVIDHATAMAIVFGG